MLLKETGFITQSEAQRLMRQLFWEQIEEHKLEKQLDAIYSVINNALWVSGKCIVDVIVPICGSNAILIGKFLIASGFRINLNRVNSSEFTKFTISIIDTPKYAEDEKPQYYLKDISL